MQRKKDILNELKEIAPEFSSVEQKNPFKVPENYFRNLPDRVMCNIPSEEPVKGFIDRLDRIVNNWLNLVFQPRYAVPVASVLLFTIISINLYNRFDNVTKNSFDQITAISTEEIHGYVLENYETEDLVAMNFTMDENYQENINYNLTNELSTEDLNYYLYLNFDEQILEEDL